MKRKKRTSVPTPVVDAVLSEDLDRVRAAVQAGGNVNERDRDGRSPLHHACIQGNEDIGDLLLASGADVAPSDDNGMTPLHFAASHNQLKIGKRLLDEGAPVDARDSNGNTPLARAVFESKGRGEMITILIEAGADRDTKNDYGVSPAELADTIVNYDVRQWLKRG